MKVDLNLPFEFQEALLSQAERRKLAKGPVANQLFAGEPERMEVKEFSLRAISIRLRTINNACDAGASLPDGSPLTEVSIYGSREHQYIVGPYLAVKNLMAGSLPARQRPHVSSDKGGRDQAELMDAINKIDLLITGLEALEAAGRTAARPGSRLFLDCLIRSRAEPSRLDRGIEVRTQDLGFLRDAKAKLDDLKSELPSLPEPAPYPQHWWQGMPPPPDLTEYERQTGDVVTRARAVLHDLEDQVFSSAWA